MRLALIKLWHPFLHPTQGTCSCLLCVTAHANLERNPSLTPWKRSESESCSVVSDSLRPQGLYSPWNSPSHNTLVGSFSLLQGIFPTQGSNPGLPHRRPSLYQLSHKGSPRILEWVTYPFSSRSSWPRNQRQEGSHKFEVWGKLPSESEAINGAYVVISRIEK